MLNMAADSGSYLSEFALRGDNPLRHSLGKQLNLLHRRGFAAGGISCGGDDAVGCGAARWSRLAAGGGSGDADRG